MPQQSNQGENRPRWRGPLACRRWRWKGLVRRIRNSDAALDGVDDRRLAEESRRLRQALLDGGAPMRFLPQAFALVCQAARRQLGMRPYDVQLLGALAMHSGCIAEMQTGEGKTLTATLPVFLAALSGQGVHVVTANDYLARRDAEWMGPIYESLGLTVGFLQDGMTADQRRAAYQCDITYTTARQLGFDFLRDRLLVQKRLAPAAGFWGPATAQPVQRVAAFALIDEADSVLIDEAQQPLIVTSQGRPQAEVTPQWYRWCAQLAPQLREDVHYHCDPESKTVRLTAEGRRYVQHAAPSGQGDSIAMSLLLEEVERAVWVRRDFLRDRQYIVRDGAVVIVDERTGRLGTGRKWREGLHQAIEAKEGLPITPRTGHDAQITLQQLFCRYRHLAGMTGTAYSARRELRAVYGLPVVRIPPHRPCRRRQLPPHVAVTVEQKWHAVAEEAQRMREAGRPVLIGTRSIDKSEQLAALLAEMGLEHNLLNAKQDAEEARIIAAAGQRGAITVATNMAGRGTDIRLGPAVAELGGLHVIVTELHDAQRIDRQLAGRCARQGDPGTFRLMLSLEDDILAEGLGEERARAIRQQWQGLAAAGASAVKLLRKAQRRVEGRRYRARRQLMRAARLREQELSRMGLDPYLGQL